jgi:hypothetical protein
MMPLMYPPARLLSSFLLALAAALCACCAPHGGPPPSAGGAPQEEGAGAEGGDEDAPVLSSGTIPPGKDRTLLGEARRELGAMRDTLYQHRIEVDEARGSFRYDCSGFVDYALSRIAPEGLGQIGQKRPKARDYVAFFESIAPGQQAGRWRRVGRASELQAGDLIAWRKAADQVSENTGHVVLVTEPPRAGARPGEMVVSIIDASGGHGPEDARAQNRTSGLGQGTIVLVLDEAGAPRGFRWSTRAISKAHLTSVAMGRLE